MNLFAYFFSRVCGSRGRTVREILKGIEELQKQIMSAIGDYSAAVNTAFDSIDTALGTVQTSLSGVAEDVAYLKDVIDKLNSNPGPITPADQALLDAAQARATALVTKVQGVSTALEQLDAATGRPEVPPA